MAATPLRGQVPQRDDRPLAQCSLKTQRDDECRKKTSICIAAEFIAP
jgi:hypothetical protein